MELIDVYCGRHTWVEYLRRGAAWKVTGGALKVGVSDADYHRAIEAGLGALGDALHDPPATGRALEFEAAQLAGGIDHLSADFNLLLGDLVWQCELGHEMLHEILAEIRLAEFEREARAYRRRAERAYRHGWYEEALQDFIAAADRNYPDYTVHRSIGQLHLYHLLDLPRALEAFRRAARYARPVDPRQAAEACYFAGIVCALEGDAGAALAEMGEAVALNPSLAEAHYQRATLATVTGEEATAVSSLEAAIRRDARYHERARGEPGFAALRPQVDELLASLLAPVAAKASEVRRDASRLSGYVIARREGEDLFGALGEVESRLKLGLSYRDGLEALATLTRLQREFGELEDHFYKQYEIDPRDYVRAVAFSPDGRLLASGFLNGGLQVWEADSALRCYSFIGHAASVNSVAFSPDSLWLASGSRDRRIRLWEAGTGHAVQELAGHAGEVRAVAFSPDGQWIASGSHDRTVRLWRAATGRLAQTLTGHTLQVTATLFGPDGSIIASGSWDRTIRLWDTASGRLRRMLTGHARGVSSLAFSPDGRYLASGGEDGQVRLWETASGRIVRAFDGLRNSISSLAFNAGGTLLAAGSLGQTIILWRVATGEIVCYRRDRNISYNAVAFSPQGQWLALGSRDLQLWLKALLTPEEHAAVRDGLERAAEARRREEEDRRFPLLRAE
jgi:tetratricopeptide (TPR) repeat protein